MTYVLRLFRSADAATLADLTLRAIRDVGTRRYSPVQVAAWAARHPGAERFLERAENGDWITVAADTDDTAVAYALMEQSAGASDGHLDMLYCHPAHTRKGLADRLLAHAENHARDQGMSRLFTEASELACPAFERAGYAVTHRRDFEIEGLDGSVSIHNYAMEKHLS